MADSNMPADRTGTAQVDRSPEDRARRRKRIRGLIGGWGVVVALFLLWQTLTYRGLIALAAEWQFNTFGRYYPSLTYILLAALIASPVLWLLRGRTAQSEPAVAPALLPGLAFIRTIIGVGAGCFAACLVVLIAMVSLPDDQGVPERIVLGTPAAANPPRTGPTILVGTVVRDRTAGLNQELLVARRTIRFAPLIGPGSGREAIRFFVEIGPNEDAATLRPDGLRQGVLRRHGLPGELEKLFRYAGYDLAQPYYTLYASTAGLRWPYRVAAGQLAIVGLICLLAAGLLHLRRERLRRRILQQRVNAA
ncbi:hypothetical protein GCM10011380_12300 [Sphingomonas metalli]|uniref:Uncharacterized protein n=1 Tax=Sphingomonas metalli TaxID=1779358 RepID=A0A916WS21_9SPHN|nr:hypothetical protein [Sphingomonas metalli]GGB24301.1 hypothetical protein GCM10011380_12300 [Sphingomonas metalli]